MQIHELNTFAGTPGDGNFLPIDNGSDTGKISGTNLLKPVNDRITNLANSVTPDSAEVILDAPAGASPGPATLSKSVANFDYLEFYFAQINGADKNNAGYLRVPVSYNNVDVSIPVKDGSGLWVQELKLAWSGTTLTISNIKLWEWDGAANSAARSQSNVWVTDVVRVIGIKTSSNTPAELADIRVGADGITYPSAGDAVRANDLKLDTKINKITPIAQHFYYNDREPYIDITNRTITFFANCPFVVNGKPYGQSKSSPTTVNIPPFTGSSPTSYYLLFLDLINSDFNNLQFVIQPYFDPLVENLAYIGQINIQNMIFSFPFNVNIDGTLFYARGKDTKAAEKLATIDCDYQTYSGGYVKASDGTIGSNANTGYTSYIDVSAFSEIWNPVDYSATYQMAFYDENKTYVSGATVNQAAPFVWKIPVPSTAKYARLSFYLSVENIFYAKGILADLKKYIESITESSASKLKGKKLGIVGDSISTYAGYIPSGYATFYPRNTVTDVEKTWWKQLLNETGMTLCVNASWSGSTISGDTTRADGYVGCSDARVAALTDGQGNKPDIIIVFMGINDFGKTNGIVCGNYEGKTAVSTETNINAITEAYGVLLKKLQTSYPNARIFVCRILPEQFASEMAASFANGFPNINPNDNISLPQLNENIEKIANAFGCGIIPMDKCGATFFNINTYTGDGLHPNALLTPKMCEVAKEALLQIYK